MYHSIQRSFKSSFLRKSTFEDRKSGQLTISSSLTDWDGLTDSGCLPASWQRTSNLMVSPVSSVVGRGEYFHSSFSDPCQDGDHNLYLQVTRPSPTSSGMWSPNSTELPSILALTKEKNRQGHKFDLQQFQRRFSIKSKKGKNKVGKSPGSAHSVYGFDNLAYSPEIESGEDEEPPIFRQSAFRDRLRRMRREGK